MIYYHSFIEKKYFKSLYVEFLLHKTLFSISCSQIAKIINEMSDIAFNFIQKICIFLPCMWFHLLFSVAILGFPGGSDVKNLPAMWETWVRSLGWDDPLEKGMVTHSGKFFLINQIILTGG